MHYIGGYGDNEQACKLFIEGMIARMGVSYYKYGAISKAYPKKIDSLETLYVRLEHYLEDGNREWLMDAGNFVMIESMYPRYMKFRDVPSDERLFEGIEVDPQGASRTEYSTTFFDNLLLTRGQGVLTSFGSVDAFHKRVLELLDSYRDEGKSSYLLEAGVVIMEEFINSTHPLANYTPQDSDTSPGRVGVNGRVSRKANDERVWSPELGRVKR